LMVKHNIVAQGLLRIHDTRGLVIGNSIHSRNHDAVSGAKMGSPKA
jgi:hypothetical protein